MNLLEALYCNCQRDKDIFFNFIVTKCIMEMLDKKNIKNINIDGENPIYVESNNGELHIHQGKSKLSIKNIMENIDRASIDLSSYTNRFQEKIHIDRDETKVLYDWMHKDFTEGESRIALLVGNAGSGKSVIMRDLYDLVKENNIPTLGIKADRILNVSSIREIEEELSLDDDILSIYKDLLEKYPICTLLIDQIDALSMSLSSQRHTINSYDRLIKQLAKFPNIRIIISTRTYDVNYDATIRSYKERSKGIVNVSPLKIEDVEKVLMKFGIDIKSPNIKLKEFLRTPLYLNLFCKVGLSKSFGEDITQQTLYDAIWDEYIIHQSNNKGIDSTKLVEILSNISTIMNDQQHIIVDKRHFFHYNKEITYLLHQELFIETSTNKLQFFHQTFFEYTHARAFVLSGKSVTNWLIEQHQGLFIRAQVRQIFSYLRDLDSQLYIKELRALFSSKKYRFHLKLMLINDLGFYNNPTVFEKRFIKDIILSNSESLQLFIESIFSIDWFLYIVEQKEFKTLVNKNDDILINLCSKLIGKYPKEIIEFIEKYQTSKKVIENTLYYIQEEDARLAFELYKKISIDWSIYFGVGNSYLKKLVLKYPSLVVVELTKHLEEYLLKVDRDERNYIPGGHDALRVYDKLYKNHPQLAIPFFIDIIEKIIKSKSYKSSHGILGDFAFYLFRPHPQKKDLYDYKDLYNIIIYEIENKQSNVKISKKLESLIDSDYANILAIGVFYLLHNTEIYINKILELFQRENFFIFKQSSEILNYYTNQLLTKSYPLLSPKQQIVVNELILRTKTDFNIWTYKSEYRENKITSNYLRYTYQLVSMIPKENQNNYADIKKVYHEGLRKYGVIKNEKPQKVTIRVGDTSYSEKAYEHMTLDNWKESFRKLNKEQRSFDDWNKPSFEGNKKQFKTAVAQNSSKFHPFLKEIVSENDIVSDYIIEGIEGLQEASFACEEIESLILDFINERKNSLTDFQQLKLLWIIKKIVFIFSQNNKIIQTDTFDYIIKITREYPDREGVSKPIGQNEDKYMDIINSGINSVRGVAVICLIWCYKMNEYKKQIFETLEYIADTANVITRACIVYEGAWLNNLDKYRAFNLYLRVMKDFHPLLLAIPAHEGHPLLYHIYIDFKKLIPFFEKAITIEEAGGAMSHFLLNAYMNDIPNSYTLLINLIDTNSEARRKLVDLISRSSLNNKRYSSKGWKLYNYLLKFSEEALGKEFESSFMDLKEVEYGEELTKFISRYLKSTLVQYRGNHFYELLRELIPSNSKQCLNWFFESNPQELVQDFYDHSPLHILIEAYNGIREYDLNNPILEKAMDTFDQLLHISEYRNNHLRNFMQDLMS